MFKSHVTNVFRCFFLSPLEGRLIQLIRRPVLCQDPQSTRFRAFYLNQAFRMRSFSAKIEYRCYGSIEIFHWVDQTNWTLEITAMSYCKRSILSLLLKNEWIDSIMCLSLLRLNNGFRCQRWWDAHLRAILIAWSLSLDQINEGWGITASKCYSYTWCVWTPQNMNNAVVHSCSLILFSIRITVNPLTTISLTDFFLFRQLLRRGSIATRLAWLLKDFLL